MACVAAMVTGETLADVVAFVGHDGSACPGEDQPELRRHGHVGFRMREVLPYLIDRGVYVGLGAAVEDESAVKAAVANRSEFPVRFSTRRRAIVTVQSDIAPDLQHVVYWDGRVVWDSNLECPTSLKRYTLQAWWPLIDLAFLS
jgi:hypothetical protein